MECLRALRSEECVCETVVPFDGDADAAGDPALGEGVVVVALEEISPGQVFDPQAAGDQPEHPRDMVPAAAHERIVHLRGVPLLLSNHQGAHEAEETPAVPRISQIVHAAVRSVEDRMWFLWVHFEVAQGETAQVEVQPKENLIEHSFQGPFRYPVVGAEQPDVLAPRQFHGLSHVPVDAAFLFKPVVAKPREPLLPFPYDLPGVVRRGSIGHENLDVSGDLGKDAVQGLADEPAEVVRGDAYREPNAAHSTLPRSCADHPASPLRSRRVRYNST